MQRSWFVRNLPNLLTASRIGVIPTTLLGYLAVKNGHTVQATAWVAATGVLTATDFVDGRLARSLNVVSELGKQLDPILDKVVLLCTFGFFVAAEAHMHLSGELWLIAGIALICRISVEIRLAGWARRTQKAGIIPGANWNGKVKFCFDCLAAAVGWVLLIWAGQDRAVAAALAFSLILMVAVYYGSLSLREYNAQLANA